MIKLNKNYIIIFLLILIRYILYKVLVHIKIYFLKDIYFFIYFYLFIYYLIYNKTLKNNRI